SIDGLIVSVAAETRDFSNFVELHERGMPIVFFDRIVNDIDTHKVVVDNHRGAYDATLHLLNTGYRKIAAIANNEILSITRERLSGYRAAHEEFGLKVDDSLTSYCDHGGLILQEVEDSVSELLSLSERPDAILALSDKL